MRHTPGATGRQLELFPERQASPQPAEEIRETLIQALAELLLQAYGEDTGEEPQSAGDRDESEDHR